MSMGIFVLQQMVIYILRAEILIFLVLMEILISVVFMETCLYDECHEQQLYDLFEKKPMSSDDDLDINYI